MKLQLQYTSKMIKKFVQVLHNLIKIRTSIFDMSLRHIEYGSVKDLILVRLAFFTALISYYQSTTVHDL